MTVTSPNGGIWRLYRGGDLVGQISEPGSYDMFWIEGSFRAHGAFEEDLRGLFDRAAVGMGGGSMDGVADALRVVRDTLSFTDPTGASVVLFNLIIDGDRARFRLAAAG